MKKILTKMKEKATNLCVGLDPHRDKMPDELSGNARAMRCFCQGVIGAISPYVGVVKVQSALFEAEGSAGMHDLERVFDDARDFGLATILDYKRGDIPDTAAYYAKAGFDNYMADAVTIQPWMGESCIRTFVDHARKRGAGVFVVAFPTTTKHEYWLDIRATDDVMNLVSRISEENVQDGYGDVGAVVSPLSPSYFRHSPIVQWRKQYPKVPFLVPGIGTQGGIISDVSTLPGTITTVSRSILFPGGDGPWKDNIVAACKQMIQNGKKTCQAS